MQKRLEFKKKRKSLDASDLVFIDESGCHPGIGPRRGWSPKGVPLWGPEQSYARSQHISMIGAISLDGLIAKATVRGGVGSREFRRFVQNQLLPVLKPGQIVCMDNLNAHKNKRVQELIESVGASVLFLPPYSPDFNPIEAAWAKIKHLIRKYQAVSVKTLRRAIYKACAKLSPDDAKGWFKHCGYVV